MSDFDTVVYNWITASLATAFPGVQVIRANQNGPRPSEPYVVYNVLNWTEASFETFETSEIDEDDLLVQHRKRNRVLVSVNAYAPNGREILTRLSFSNRIWEIRRALENARVSTIRTASIQDLTFLDDTRFMRRFETSFEFLVSTGLDETRPRVTEITVTGNPVY